ncbi:hypothetical protein TA3x_005050 [Tundrisphaera sp. TA3]|uniref:hypothetical protein n=1 Tax=Tundrisphaera sp. TA3 TaxID=3435775 RepID=UPI003EBA0CCD
MRYFFAVVCPPLAFLSCGRWFRAAVASVFFALAIATMHMGLGVLIEFFLILWAIGSVGDENARLISQGFVATVSGPQGRGAH